jgi:chromosome segregation ATPase
MNNEEKILEILGSMQQSIQGIEKRMDSMEKRMDSMERRMDAIENRMDAIEKRIDGIEKRIDGIEKRLDDIEGGLKENVEMTKALKYASERMEAQIANLQSTTASAKAVQALNVKVQKLEDNIRDTFVEAARKWA